MPPVPCETLRDGRVPADQTGLAEDALRAFGRGASGCTPLPTCWTHTHTHTDTLTHSHTHTHTLTHSHTHTRTHSHTPWTADRAAGCPGGGAPEVLILPGASDSDESADREEFSSRGPQSSKLGTCKTVEARFRPWLSG